MGGIILAVVLGLAGLYVVTENTGDSPTQRGVLEEDASRGVAVLPFRVSDPDLQSWREGIMDLVSTNIDGAVGLRAIDSRVVLARLRESGDDSQVADDSAGLVAAQRAGALYAISGSVSALGSELRISANVYDLNDSRNLGQVSAQGPPDSVYVLIDRFSVDVLQTILGDESANLPSVNLRRATTSSIPALKAFLEGQVLFRESDFNSAIPAYQTAVEIDSTFALALYRLGLAYGWAEDVDSDLLEHYVERAMRFADRLPERDAILVEGALAAEKRSLDAVEPLQLATRKYPDATEAWYLLADTYYHLGNRIPVADEEAEKLFIRAIEVDPGFSPAYIHALDYAFYHADSTRAAELLDRYSEIAGGGKFDRRFRLLFALAWGGQTDRETARGVFDTLDQREANSVAGRLWHPRFLPLLTQLYLSLRERENPSRALPLRLFWANYFQGRQQAAMSWLEDPSLTTLPGYQLYWLHNRGWPIPTDRLANALEVSLADTISTASLFYLAAYAADQGQWDHHAQITGRMRSEVERLGAEGDSLQARAFLTAIRALEGQAQWRRGRADEAAVILEEAHENIADIAQGNIVRDWLAQLYEELGDSERALEYQRTYRARNPLVEFSLGHLYEDIGEFERARESFELFLSAFADADPELQAMVEEARQAIIRLEGLRRE